MENLKESSEILDALSDGMADAVEKAGQFVVRVNSRRRRGASGVVFGKSLILMADHSLQREDGLSVETHDGRKLSARIAGRDPSSDLALLEAEGLNAEAATLAEEQTRVGQLALAIGRSGREGLRASFGVVSAVGGPLRTGRGSVMERYVQTGATPYPGLGGGPLIDARGGVIGIVVAGMMRGVTLAVPADVAWGVAGTLKDQGHVRRGYLGILSQPVSLPPTQRPEGRSRGLLVVGVEEDSPARSGGMLMGDVLIGLDGQPVEDTDELQALLSGERVGKEVAVEVIRGGEMQTVHVTVVQRR